MKKIILPTLGALILITGCSSSKLSLNNELSENQVLKYNNTNHIIKDSNTYITKVTYLEKINEKINKKIVFYVDKFPYKRIFNLCNTNTFLKEIQRKKNLTFSNIPYNECKSTIYINKNKELKVPYEISYNFSFLDNYKYDKRNQTLLENTSRNNSLNGFYSIGLNKIVKEKNINTLEKSIIIENSVK